jgi:putative ABC transport system permease protein
MPDWVKYVREHLPLPKCPPAREGEIIEEIAQQLDDVYQESLHSGLSEWEAFLAAEQHISDWPALASDLMHSGFGQARKPNLSGSPEEASSLSAPTHRLAPPQMQSTGTGTGRQTFKTRFAHVLGVILQDLHYATRIFAKKPLFGIIAIVTLAVGIGANTAIFGVVDSVLFRPLPYPEGNRLTVIWSTLGKEGRCPGSGPQLLSLRERSKLFDQFAGIWVQSGALTGRGEPEQVKRGWVTANFLSLLSDHPEAGRLFVPQDEGEGRAPVVVISHELWQRHFGADPNLVGRSIMLNDRPYTVVGILPPGFKILFPEGASVPANIDVYSPFNVELAKLPRDQGFIRIIGRLRDGVTIPQAQAELDTIARQLRAEFPEYSEEDLHLQTLSLHGDVTRNARPSLVALFAGTGFVLMIVCANIAMLFLSRANERRNEMSVRAALGADPGRLIRQLLTESVFLSFLGGIAALGVTYGILKALWALEPAGIGRTTSISLNFTVLAFNIAISVVCGILVGLFPALDARAINLNAVLRESSKTTTESRHVMRQLLIGGEVALTFILLTCSVLLIRTFADLLHVEPGFRSRNVLTFHVSLPDVRYTTPQAADQFFQELQRRLSALPGVQSVGVVSHLPFDDSLPNWYDYFWREGAPKDQQNMLMADHRAVYPGFFDSMGITFMAGRNFDTSDEVGHRKVVIIDDSLANQLWPHENAIGKLLNVVNGDFVRDVAEVVGVVKHVQYHSLTDQVRPQLYLPYSIAARGNMSVTVLAKSSPELLIPLIREQVREMDKDLPLSDMRLMDGYVSDARLSTRFITFLCGSLGAIALLLSCIGIYGVTSGSVTSRKKEIGVRMALGAQQHNIAAMVLRRSMTPVILGGVAGLVMSIGVTPLLSSLFFGVHPIDPLVLVAVLLFLCFVALLASSLPTQRVLRGNPINALRCE